MPKLFLTIAITVTTIFCNAQLTTLLHQGEPVKVTFSPNNGQLSTFDNQILEILKICKTTGAQNNQLVFDLKEHRKIVKTTDKTTATIELGNLVLNGSFNYKLFDIKPYLIPDIVSFTYNFNTANGQIIETNTITNQQFKPGDNLVKIVKHDIETDTTYKLFLSNIQLGFSKNSLKQIDHFVKLVDDYYNAGALLNLINQQLNTIVYDSIEMLETYQLMVLNHVKMLNQLKTQKFVNKLELDINDPIAYKPNFSKTDTRNKDAKKQLDNTLSNMHITYCNKGIDWLNRTDTNKANQLFLKSIQLKNNYAPPHYHLAQYYASKKLYFKTLDTCKNIINNLKPGTDTRYATIKLAESVIYKIIDSTKLIIGQNNFDSAFVIIEKTRNYANSIQGVKPFTEFDQLQGIIYQKIYNKLILQTDSLIKNNLLFDAYTNIDSVLNFESKYQQHIVNSSKTDTLLNNLYNSLITLADSLLNTKNIETAVKCINYASNICNKHNAVPCSQMLTNLQLKANTIYYNSLLNSTQIIIDNNLPDSAIAIINKAENFRKANNLKYNYFSDTLYIKANQLIYNNLINNADNLITQRKYQNALNLYEKAVQISENIAINKNPQIPEKTKQAAAQTILLYCNQGETLIDAMQLVQANNKLNESIELSEFYNLGQNTEVSTAIRNLSEKINQGNCSDALLNYNIKVSSAKKLIAKKEFINADNALDNAIDIAKSQTCNLNDSLPKTIKKQISAMVTYQKQLQQVNELINQKNFDRAIDLYSELTTFYNNSCANNNYKIVHLSVYNFIYQNPYNDFIDYSIRFFTTNNNTSQALQLLNLLYQRGYEPAWTKQSQTNLGKQLAINDYQINPNNNPKIKIIDYTNNQKWYNNLRKAYLLQWKNMQ